MPITHKLFLPPELLDMVFTSLRPSESDWHASWPKSQEVREPLNACTLVSRSWHHPAREHLFRDVVYSFQRPPTEGEEAWPTLGAQSRWGPCPLTAEWQRVTELPFKTLEMFADFLGKSPAIRSSIRRLRLACYPTINNNSWPSIWGYDLQKMDNIDPVVLTSLVGSLPRLRQFLPWNIFVNSPLTSTATPHISVPDVQLRYGVGHPDSLGTCGILTCLGNVDELVIVRPSYGYIGIKRDKDKLPDTFPASVLLDIRSLTVRSVWNDPPLHCISQLLRRSPSANNLRKLVLDAISFEAVPGMEKMIRELGPYLEFFKVTLVDSGRTGYYNEIFDLSAISNLKELAIGVSPEIHDVQVRDGLMVDSMAYFRTAVLSPQSNPQLQKITFCFGNGDRALTYDSDEDGDEDGDEEDEHEGSWWDHPQLRPHIDGFEKHFAGLVHTFKLKGVFFECHDDIYPHPFESARIVETLRQMVPLIFRHLSHDGLLILEDNTLTTA